jgi:hypothetical protein
MPVFDTYGDELAVGYIVQSARIDREAMVGQIRFVFAHVNKIVVKWEGGGEEDLTPSEVVLLVNGKHD